MERKRFLGRTLQLAAGIGLGCPSLAWPVEEPNPAPGRPEAFPCKAAGDYPHATSFEKRAEFAKAWAGRWMKVLDERLDERTRRELMEANGRLCALRAYGPPDPAKTMSLDEFVKAVAARVGEANCRLEGDVVYFAYKQGPDTLQGDAGHCFCKLVEDGPADLSPTYCNCSVGHVGYMFERFIGRPVRVELLESVRRGGKACRFAVRLRDGPG